MFHVNLYAKNMNQLFWVFFFLDNKKKAINMQVQIIVYFKIVNKLSKCCKTSGLDSKHTAWAEFCNNLGAHKM